MSYNKYRGIETAVHTLSDALSQLEDLNLLEDGKGPNEYEMKALPMFINSCIEALDLYIDAVNYGYVELHPRIDMDKLKAAVSSLDDEDEDEE
jgi:hypothetical protein